MTSVPSPSPPGRTPPSASDSGNSASHSPTPPKNQVEGATNNGVFHSDEKKPDIADGLDHLDSTEYIERLRKYDSEYSRRLMAKYFSGKSFYGGTAYDVQMTIDDEIIKSSRLPCYRSYLDPVVGFEDHCSNGSTPLADAQANLSNGKHMVKKSN